MPSKRVQEFVTRNANSDKSVELTLNTGKVYYGVLESYTEGKGKSAVTVYTVKTGSRGRPPRILETDIKSVKHYKPEPKPEPVAKTQAKPKAKPQAKQKPVTPQAVPAPRSSDEDALDAVPDPTPEEIAAAESLAEELRREPLSV